MIYNPVSTYRIQFSREFTFADLVRIIPYLHRLGVRTIYASPVFAAVPGSSHGYDVINPLDINNEIGTLEEFRKINQRLLSLDMGWIQDIVPNHMALSVHNPWIYDILEKGQNSKYSEYFDIEWDHPDARLKGKIFLPLLGRPIDEIINSGEISADLNNSGFVFKGSGNEFPMNIDSYPVILERRGKRSPPDGLELLIETFGKRGGNGEAAENAKVILAGKYAGDNDFREYISENLMIINSRRDILEKLIQLQYYVPAYWKESDKVLNYRRFFIINGLICLKMDKKRVFDAYHAFTGRLCRDDLLQGLRVDHIDGLQNPEEYLLRLRELAGSDKYICVEKILGENESLEKTWPVQGETGYQFLSLLNNLLVSKKNTGIFEGEYRHWNNHATQGFGEILYQKKSLILYSRMAQDLDNLHNYFVRLDITDLKPFDQNKLKNAIGEFLLSCPVYRVYKGRKGFSRRQVKLLANMFENALSKAPDLSDELLLLKGIFLDGKELFPGKSAEIDSFFRRCMQFTGPLAAKGGEDTAYYSYNSFLAHNEVGDSPGFSGISASRFHAEMIRRQKQSCLNLNATSTHDTKRGEDARARLCALSDLPELWTAHVKRWRKMNLKFKKKDRYREIPVPNNEYFIYQTIAGFMPAGSHHSGNFEERLEAYINKSLREAKSETNWYEPDFEYEDHTRHFIHSILSDDSEFIKSLSPFLEKLAYLGIINSLTQTLLKFTLPGIPDIYQGSESWNFSFTDPDNRRPVDFKMLERQLTDHGSEQPGICHLFFPSCKQEVKIFLTRILLKIRNSDTELFEKGDYVPLKTEGRFKEMAFSFARRYGETTIIPVVPLHAGKFFDKEGIADMKQIDWQDTAIDIPVSFPSQYENLLTGNSVKFENRISLSALFSEIPFGLLKG